MAGRRIVRTTDDIRFELEVGDGPAYVRDAEGAGELVRSEIADSLRTIAVSIESSFRTGLTPARPDGIEVEFGLRLDAESGFIVSKGTAEAHLIVTLTWTRSDTISEG